MYRRSHLCTTSMRSAITLADWAVATTQPSCTYLAAAMKQVLDVVHEVQAAGNAAARHQMGLLQCLSRDEYMAWRLMWKKSALQAAGSTSTTAG